MQKEYKVIDFPPLTDEEREVLEDLKSMPDKRNKLFGYSTQQARK